MFSRRPRFSECEDKTRQGNALQEHTVAVIFIWSGYDLAKDQRQGKAGLVEPDAEVISRSILPRQVGHGTALHEHGTLPGQFPKGENKYNTTAIKSEARLLIISKYISRLSRPKERWKYEVTFHSGCLD